MSTAELPRLIGGDVALDLVNTVAPRLPDRGAAEDYLPTPDALLHWSARAGLLTAAQAAEVAASWASSPGAADRAMRATLEIREATYDVLLAVLGVPAPGPPDAALERLTLRWTAAVARSALTFRPGSGAGREVTAGPPVHLAVGQVPAWSVPDRLADACVELLRGLDPRQLKACPPADGGCGWVFLDRSRNGSRRWCTMQDCGAHAKARRLTQRRRGSATGKEPFEGS